MPSHAPTSEAPFPVIPGFEIVRRIGQGGMGEIFEAVRVGAGGFRKSVALKTLNPGPEPAANTLDRFLNECRITARLEHPNIVRVHDLLTVGGRHFLVMELLRGVDLSALRRLFQGGAPAWVALVVAEQVLEGLAYAHALADERGRSLALVHRDLTPRNLFLCNNGTVKILDFGVARMRDAAAMGISQEGMVTGTMAYLSPEHARGLPPDARSDLFQVGATLYALLTGQAPYGTSSRLEDQLERACQGRPDVPLHALRPDLPSGVVVLVGSAMASDPARRFVDARQMLQAVRAELAAQKADTGGLEKLAALAMSLVQKLEQDEDGAPTHYAGVPSSAPGRLDIGSPAIGGVPLDGRYRIVRFVAQGGMGAVYEAEDIELRKRIALKVLRPELAGDAGAVERFKQEIHLAHRVTHPNVCRIFDIGFHSGPMRQGGSSQQGRMVFLTMELLQGETLAHRLRRTGAMSTGDALPLVIQMVLGLAAAHRAGVVHGDFKSENVMLEPSTEGHPHQRVVITDFGLARARVTGPPGTGSQALLGTPAYLAPEQVKGGPPIPASDVYALGVMLYEMVTGELPFTGETPLEMARQRLRVPPPSPSARKPGLAPTWEALILRCLERDPARRFQDAEEVLSVPPLELFGEQLQLDPVVRGGLVWRAEASLLTPSRSVEVAAKPPGPDRSRITQELSAEDRKELSRESKPAQGELPERRPRDVLPVPRSSPEELAPQAPPPDVFVLRMDPGSQEQPWSHWSAAGVPPRALVHIEASLDTEGLHQAAEPFPYLMIAKAPVDSLALGVAHSWMKELDRGGIEQLPHKGTVRSLQLGTSAQKAAYVDALVEDARGHGVRPRGLRALGELGEEMILNAIFHAPVGADGVRRYAHRDRASLVALSPGEEARLRWAICQRFVAVSIRDPFGSLQPAEVLGSITGRNRRPRLADSTVGAGMGLHIMARAAQHLFVALSPGVSCEVMALVEREPHEGTAGMRTLCILREPRQVSRRIGDRLRLVEILRPGGPRLVLRGEIDESSQLGPLFERTDEVYLDLSGVQRINSVGLRAWLEASRARAPGLALRLERCSMAVVSQLNRVPLLQEADRVLSVLAPYRCPQCKQESLEEVLLDGPPESLPPERECGMCGGKLRFDDMPEEYFAFTWP